MSTEPLRQTSGGARGQGWRSDGHARPKNKRARRTASCSRASARATRLRPPAGPMARSRDAFRQECRESLHTDGSGSGRAPPWPSLMSGSPRASTTTSTVIQARLVASRAAHQIPEDQSSLAVHKPCCRAAGKVASGSWQVRALCAGGRPSKRPKKRFLSTAPVDTSEGVRHGRRGPRVSIPGKRRPQEPRQIFRASQPSCKEVRCCTLCKSAWPCL